MPDVRAVWRSRVFEAVWGAAYNYGIEHEWLSAPIGRVVFGSDVRLLYDSLRVVGEMPDGSAILDMPCGGGLAFRGMRPEQDVRYVAADISVSMLDRARRRAAQLGLDGIEYVETDVESMPFPDAEFDLGVCFNGLHCMPDPAAALVELTRTLKPGGRLVGDCLIRDVGRSDAYLAALRRLGVFGPGGRLADVERWLTDAGLRIDRLERSGALAHFAATRGV
ncbi:MAG: methyltransferase domain-containing protein [Propionibacteriales bacterium]|nr:methyltransferase domain-containing protein [Propionibacteriales bacterium]